MSDEQCKLIRELSSNMEYQVVIALKCILCCVGAFGVGYQWMKQGARFLVHENTKIAFNLYYALNLLLSIVFIFFYSFELIRLRFDCVVVNFRVVLLTKGVAICTSTSSLYVIILISIERLYSALFPAHFEKHSSRRLSLFVTISAILMCSTFTMYCLSDGFRLFRPFPVALLDERIDVNSHMFDKLILVMASSTAVSFTMLCFDVYLNFVRKQSKKSIAIKYQISENRRVLLTILPIKITESLIQLFTTSAHFVHDKYFERSTPVEVLTFHEITTYPMLFPIFLALIIEFRVTWKNRNVVNADHEIEHFEKLRLAWS